MNGNCLKYNKIPANVIPRHYSLSERSGGGPPLIVAILKQVFENLRIIRTAADRHAWRPAADVAGESLTIEL
jgi:hypothetical protein